MQFNIYISATFALCNCNGGWKFLIAMHSFSWLFLRMAWYCELYDCLQFVSS